MWSRAVLAKYWAMQLPAALLVLLVLVLFEDRHGWPAWVVWTIVALWVAKDAILYPFAWRAYDPTAPSEAPYTMEGAKGVALERIDPLGMVRVSGELWRAELSRSARPIEQGEAVQVNARRGLTLLVQPEVVR